MGNYQGRRYEEKEKLNIGKVILVIFVIAAIVGIIYAIRGLFHKTEQNKSETKTAVTQYFAAYTNEKWGVINSNGETVIEPTYDELVIIPDSSKDLFIVTYDVDYEKESYKTKVINKNSEDVFVDYDEVSAIANEDDKGTKWYEAGVLKVKKDNLYGLIDLNGTVLLPVEYTDISPIKGIERSLVIEKDKKKGLYNNVSQQQIIPPEYQEITALGKTYDSGYIVKDEEGKLGVISADQKQVLENKYKEIRQVSGNDMYAVIENRTVKVINSKGEDILIKGFDDIVGIHGNHILIESNKKYGVLSTTGEVEVKPEYDSIEPVFGNDYIVSQNGKYGVIDEKGEAKLNFDYTLLQYREDAGWLEGEKDGVETEIIDNEFQVRMKGIVTEINKEKGYARLYVDHEYKYYNFKFEEKQNVELLPTNTLYLVKQDGKYGFKNKAGELIVDYIYDDATEQNAYGFAAVKKDGLWGAIQSDGRVIVEPSINLDENEKVDFIGKWYLYKDSTLNAYTK